ncbi:hypothetical protein ACWD04_08380 [Streptomyces sp. NPDC002911]
MTPAGTAGAYATHAPQRRREQGRLGEPLAWMQEKDGPSAEAG